jgi:hypothetical protein
MKKLEPDWLQQQPSPEAVRTMWEKLQLENIPITHPELLQFVHSLKVVFSRGGALLYHFQVSENLTFDWFAYRNRLEEIDGLHKILSLPALRAAAAELMIDPALLEIGQPVVLPDAFDLSGRLTRKLFYGGPHNQDSFDAHEALQKASSFVEQILQDRYTEVVVCVFYEPWADWFFGEGWDETYLIYDKRHRQIWLLCLTDPN